MKNVLRILGTIAFALTFFLSSCANSSEEATIDTGIRERLNAATGFSWKVEPLNKAIEKSDQPVYSSEGYIQQLWPKDSNKCSSGVYVYENVEYAKIAQAQYFRRGFPQDDSFPRAYVMTIEDPLTNYGIILTQMDEPCSDAVASTFDFVLPWSN